MKVTEAAKHRQWGVRRQVVSRVWSTAQTFDLSPPGWAARLLDGGLRSFVAREFPFSLSVREADRFTLVTSRVANATHLDAGAFERCAAGVYAAMADVLTARRGRFPVRFWNHIPDIRRSDSPGVDRYMVFNSGRFSACSEWFGSPDAFDRLLPTASAVGHGGADLVVHMLAADGAGRALENPRQVPSYRYSTRFGPRPPCFARATEVRWPGAATILVGGTASIRGEETMHSGNLQKQAAETFENLSALVCSAGAPGAAAFESLRVYYVHEADRRAIVRIVSEAFPHLHGIEYVRAELCRPELLIEIEGVARGPTAH